MRKRARNEGSPWIVHIPLVGLRATVRAALLARFLKGDGLKHTVLTEDVAALKQHGAPDWFVAYRAIQIPVRHLNVLEVYRLDTVCPAS